MIVTERKNLVGIVIKRGMKSYSSPFWIFATSLETFMEYNFWLGEATKFAVVSTDSSDPKL